MGRLLALKYAKAGATVVGWDINEHLNNQTIQEIKKMGYTRVYGYKCDVSDRANVFEVANRVENEVGNVTILINNAGIMPSHSFLEHTEDEIRRIININVMGNFWTLQAFLPTMKRNNHGHVVALSSIAGCIGCTNLVPYNASKFAVKGLMEGLYEEFRRYPKNQVEFTTIYPFMVDTGLCKNYEITADFIMPMAKAEEVVNEIFNAQTRNIRHIIVPTYMTGLIDLFTKYWPREVTNHARDTFRAELKSDLEIVTNGNSIKKHS